MAAIDVWEQRYGEGYWTPEGVITIPKNYAFLPAGDAPLTRAVKLASGSKSVYVVMVKKKRQYFAQELGIWAPGDVIERETARLEAMRTPNHVARLVRQRKQAQQRDIRKFAEEIRKSFPGCPDDEAQTIASWTCRIGSGRVGRSSTADDPVRAAVIAHIRHEYTNYDSLLDQARESAIDREDMDELRRWARDEVWGEIEKVLARWEQAASHPSHCSSDPRPV